MCDLVIGFSRNAEDHQHKEETGSAKKEPPDFRLDIHSG